MDRRYSVVDVFTDTPLMGNPVAVVHDAAGLSDAQMHAIARWTQLSETTFVLAPNDPAADYRLRIFTPAQELPFAGHPTLGSCHAWLQAGGVARSVGEVVQECGIGRVRIRGDAARRAFAAPPLHEREVAPVELGPILAALGLHPSALRAARWLDNGPVWLGLLLDSAHTVLSLRPDHAALKSLAKVGVVGAYPSGSAAQFELRAFAASAGVPEDPVTGSLNASVAQWLIGSAQAPGSYEARQGACLGRAGRVHVDSRDDAIWIGGATVGCVHGVLSL